MWVKNDVLFLLECQKYFCSIASIMKPIKMAKDQRKSADQ